MPNRIIKESAFLSDRIASLSDFEFRLWVGLITQADDAGLGDARPAIIKGHVFALRERVTVKDIENALCALAAAGCVSLYTVDGKPYYAFPSWTKHQRIRDCKPKYPMPSENDISPQVAADCGELPRVAADCGLNPIQSEYNPNINPNTKNTRAGACVPPTLEEVEAYCRERNSSVNAKEFFDYFTAGNWTDAKGQKVKNWKQKVITWEKFEPKKKTAMPSMDYGDTSSKVEQMRRMVASMEAKQ